MSLINSEGIAKQSVQNTQNYTTPQFSNSPTLPISTVTKLSQWIECKLIADAMVNSKKHHHTLLLS
jgi:hypothetical protein